MATTPTSNPIPSEAPQDLKFNAGEIDEFVTSSGWTYTDRFGVKRYTIEGMNYLAQQVMNAFGYVTLTGVTFTTGATIANPNEVLFNSADNSYYKWTGSFASGGKVVPANSTPSSTGGIGPGKWLNVGDTNLRSDLAKSTGAGLIGTSTGSDVQTVLLANDSASYRDRCITKLAEVDYKVRSGGSIKVLFQGDSMTAGYDMTTTDVVAPNNGDWAKHATTTYPSRFTSYLNEQAGVAVSMNIRAISGHTAKQAFDQPEWQSNPSCDIAFLMYGLNDAQGTAGATHDIYIEYMEKLIRRFIDWGMGVVVLTCANGGYGSADRTAQLYSRQIKNMATVYGCSYFNANEVQYNRVFSAVQSDNGHFNSNGYARLGDELASMVMAGGLMSHYRPVSSELTMWPGMQSDQVGYYNPQKNIDTLRYPSAYTLQGIAGGFPPNSFAIMSFSFYLDAEAADVDIVASWTTSVKIVFAMQQSTASQAGVTVTYYDPTTYSSNSAENVRGYSSGLTLNNGNTSNGGPKHLGMLSGRGWKTITVYTPQDNTGTVGGYIQGITIRPIPRYLASRDTPGTLRRGIKEVVMLSYPSRDFNISGTPAPAALNTLIMPLPYDLNPISWDNASAYFDCGYAKLEISGVQAGVGVVYFEALLSKQASGNNITVTELKKVGTWPTITAVSGTKASVINVPKYSLGTDMPLADITGMGGDSTFTASSYANKFGLFLKLTFTWSGTAPTGFYNINLESGARGLGGAATMATTTP